MPKNCEKIKLTVYCNKETETKGVHKTSVLSTQLFFIIVMDKVTKATKEISLEILCADDLVMAKNNPILY